jgi:acyl-CoA thioester hydrolase
VGPERAAQEVAVKERELPRMPDRRALLGDLWHPAELRVRYKDTDRMGVVYYGNYLTYFEVGRTELMRRIGFPYAALEAAGLSLVVVEALSRYHANVGYDALITVCTRLSEAGRVRLRFDYRVFDAEGRLLVDGHTAHACVNGNGRPVRIPADLLGRLTFRTPAAPADGS